MNIYATILLLSTIAIVQSTAMPHVAIMGVKPNLMLLVVISWSLLRGIKEGSIWGLVGGLILDTFSSAPFGVSTLAMLAVSLLAGLGEMSAFRTHIILPPLAAFLATPIYHLIFLSLLQIVGWPVAWIDSLLKIILPSTLLNTALMPLIYGAMRWLCRRVVGERIKLAGD